MTGTASAEAAPLLSWNLLAEAPHDTADFTEGLASLDGRLYESSGLYGRSRIAEKDIATGHTLHMRRLPDREFGEGLTALGGVLWQLTWHEGVVHRYDATLNELPSGFLVGEAWGLTSDGQQLIVSNGSHRLSWVAPDTLRPTRVLPVWDDDAPLRQLNELEWIEPTPGQAVILANIWYSDRVACIDPQSGRVRGWLDFSSLRRASGITDAQQAAGAVLNGLAWDARTQRLLVTGKNWPRLFAVRIDNLSAVLGGTNQ